MANTIDAVTLSKMFLGGAKALEAKKAWINELNVFPVPDGDTGTNMTLTIMSAAKDVAVIENVDMSTLAKAMSSGSLRGARGNSGVILSQLIRGFTKSIREYEEIDIVTLCNAMQKATETAYKAVMKPKEGTILTVAKGAADKAAELVQTEDDMAVFIDKVIEHAEYVLSQTPEMLPVLKEAGVVDSGGQGLVEILKGAQKVFLGEEIDFSLEEEAGSAVSSGGPNIDVQADMEIKFGYCTEFIIMIEPGKVFNAKNEADFKTFLESIGDSIVCVADEDLVKVHVHTNDPGLAIQKALTYGELTKMKIDNMREEHREKLFMMSEKQNGAEVSADEEIQATSDVADDSKAEEEKPVFTEPAKDMGFISVSVGEGLDAIFKGLGVDYIISGGQTMNPSTEDMLRAIDHVNAKTIFILPNNKNIIMAANQAQYLVEDKEIIVIPTKTVPQGITALINFDASASPAENEEIMSNEIKNVKTGQVTYAVRDTVINDMEIKQGNIMGIGDHEILAVGNVVELTTIEMLEKMIDDDSELISIYYGDEVDEAIAGDLEKEIADKFPDCDIELHFGGQPIYYYIVSVE